MDRRVAGRRHPRIRTATLAALLILAGALQAQVAEVTPLLYVATRDTSVYYIYGSIHAAPPEAVPPPMVVRAAFERSRLLVTEIALTDDLLASVTSVMMDRMFLDEDETLEEFYSPAEWRRILAWARGAGMPAEGIMQMQPWALELVAAQSAAMPENFSADYGLDFYFGSKASARGVRNLGLETIEDQLDMLSAATLEEQARSLLATIDGLGSNRDTIDLYLAWRAGDETALAEIIESGIGSAGSESYDRLLTLRNEAWASQMDTILNAEDEPAFVVVGAAHLVGARNLLELLGERGYTVRRVRSVTDL